jgi:hypothetical protein
VVDLIRVIKKHDDENNCIKPHHLNSFVFFGSGFNVRHGFLFLVMSDYFYLTMSVHLQVISKIDLALDPFALSTKEFSFEPTALQDLEVSVSSQGSSSRFSLVFNDFKSTVNVLENRSQVDFDLLIVLIERQNCSSQESAGPGEETVFLNGGFSFLP